MNARVCTSSLRKRIEALEAAHPDTAGRYAHLSDEEMHARILDLTRKALEVSGMDPAERRIAERCLAVEAGADDPGSPWREYLEVMRAEAQDLQPVYPGGRGPNG